MGSKRSGSAFQPRPYTPTPDDLFPLSDQIQKKVTQFKIALKIISTLSEKNYIVSQTHIDLSSLLKLLAFPSRGSHLLGKWPKEARCF